MVKTRKVYGEEEKARVVAKMFSPEFETWAALERETGISGPTLKSWYEAEKLKRDSKKQPELHVVTPKPDNSHETQALKAKVQSLEQIIKDRDAKIAELEKDLARKNEMIAKFAEKLL